MTIKTKTYERKDLNGTKFKVVIQEPPAALHSDNLKTLYKGVLVNGLLMTCYTWTGKRWKQNTPTGSNYLRFPIVVKRTLKNSPHNSAKVIFKVLTGDDAQEVTGGTYGYKGFYSASITQEQKDKRYLQKYGGVYVLSSNVPFGDYGCSINYIGSSYDIEGRFKQHKQKLDKNKHSNDMLQDRFNEHDNFKSNFLVHVPKLTNDDGDCTLVKLVERIFEDTYIRYSMSDLGNDFFLTENGQRFKTASLSANKRTEVTLSHDSQLALLKDYADRLKSTHGHDFKGSIDRWSSLQKRIDFATTSKT
ncbi:hypothetical protein JQC92_02960 [Shewanella sp. 202IG2-18]|uniref:GIY-YIG nuclease family protein n=1 Tax=Parashewanella hymeniacidonis TaxID=2807618 RepID=UPI0019610537|nr:GIY-YIG nuclease family protein [Parashewanella hymeniacidonis]MBM7071001.1 hypothetical protein [Parashewanella hymeniacidonis]